MSLNEKKSGGAACSRFPVGSLGYPFTTHVWCVAHRATATTAVACGDCGQALKHQTSNMTHESALLPSPIMRQLVFGLVFGFGCSAFAQMAPVADRVAKQNALFEEYYQAFLKNNPERATAFGDYRYNSQLAQVSLKEIAKQHAENDDFLARLKAIPTDDMSDKDLLS